MITIRKRCLALVAAIVLGLPALAAASDKQAGAVFDGVNQGSYFLVYGYNSEGFSAPGRVLQIRIIGREPMFTFGDEVGTCIVTYDPYSDWMSNDGNACSVGGSGGLGGSWNDAFFGFTAYFYFKGYVDVYVDCIDEQGGIGPLWVGSGWIPGYEG